MSRRSRRWTSPAMRRASKSASCGRVTPVELRQGEAFEDLFRTFERTAFHLEVADTYHTPEESGPFQLFLEGHEDDFVWHEPWLSLLRATTATGKQVRRVRV